MREEVVKSIRKAFVNGNRKIDTIYRNADKELYETILVLRSLCPLRDLIVKHITINTKNEVIVTYDYAGENIIASHKELAIEQLLTIEAWLKNYGFLVPSPLKQ